jgi:hypothetical protein
MHNIEWIFSGIGVSALGWVGYLVYQKFHHRPQVQTDKNSVPTAILRESKKASLRHWLKVNIRVRKGDYYPTNFAHPALKITVTDIRIASLPDKWDSKTDQLAVELDVDLGGHVIFGGASTLSVGVNKFLLPRAEHEESAESIYLFLNKDSYSMFLRICVTHINAHDNYAELSVVQSSIDC